MPTPPRRWSPRLEDLRAGADAAAEGAAADLAVARKAITEARKLFRSDPEIADRLAADALAAISQAETEQERIRRLMLLALIGR